MTKNSRFTVVIQIKGQGRLMFDDKELCHPHTRGFNYL